uniref:Kinesin-like protein n=1 Tax=Tetraodon nigroviridis TaxID=99883 RepID=H3DK11_TETNG
MLARDCVKVAVRVRPFNKREKDAGSRCVVSMLSSSITLQDPRDCQSHRSFLFDYAYWSHSGFVQDCSGLYVPEEPGGRYADQDSVFRDLGEGILENALQGYNATLLAYGQTGSGKSYSMVGYGPNKGLVPKLSERLFQDIKGNLQTRQCQVIRERSIGELTLIFASTQVFFSMLEIYNEQSFFAFPPLSRCSTCWFGALVHRGVSGSERNSSEASTWRDCEQSRVTAQRRCRTGSKPAPPAHTAVDQLMEQGTRTRTTAATHMNASSSRSHMLIILQLKQIFSRENVTKQSTVNLVDLAGSERQRLSGSEADRLKEGTAINLSLTTLGNVISSLADVAAGRRGVHVPYRDSALTKLLQSALGGNSRTVMGADTAPRATGCHFALVLADCHTEPCRHLLRGVSVHPALRRQERRMMQMHPYILNVNKDAQLSGVVKLFIQEGEWVIGLCDSSPNSIPIKGLGIQERHAVFRNEHRRDRLILGSNCTYLFIGYPSERGADEWRRYDYDYFQSELVAAEGLHLGASGTGSSRSDPSLLAVWYDYIQLMPMTAEANQMSQELGKVTPTRREDESAKDPDQVPRTPAVSTLQGVEFHLEIKNLALSDAKGHDLEKKIVVRVTAAQQKQVWVWSKAKFVNRKFLMEEVYQQHLLEKTNEDGGLAAAAAALPRDKDPFWDPVEPLLLGTAHLWLHSLAYRIPLEEQLEVMGSEGTDEGIVQAELVPCTSSGLYPLGEDDILIDPCELLGGRLDFQLVLERCCGLRWVREEPSRGVQIGFRLFECSRTLFAPAVWRSVNPGLHHSVRFTSARTSQRPVRYLQSSALVLELWGLQEGCTDLGSGLEGVSTTSEGVIVVEEAGPEGAAVSLEPAPEEVKLEDMEDLKRVNASLQKENQSLREQLAAARSGSTRPSCDAEFARSLKVFYHSMTSVRAELQQSRLLKDFSEQLEQSVAALKQDVAAIVRRKRERSGIWS